MVARAEISVGRVLRPWGRAGAVVVEPWTNDPHRFERLSQVEVDTAAGARTLAVNAVRIDPGGRPIVSFDGVESISAAESLRGAELRIAEGLAERPAGAAWFVHELVGLEVWTASGQRVGRVESLLETGAVPILVVRDSGAERLVPLATEIVIEVDPGTGRLTIAPPEGLLELNERGAHGAV